ncbi:cop9 signalosome complex subunit 2 [Nannochloropsis gaditana]|uniref:Cop9 signalosome complex subunit 2 n=1 Tax=Nannochloropsis gaditana TaxID=72520 RepID=W7TTN0_9STRA|nr:cop9 signalosome complex subunit 2 [Nannochloropsis gaditana]
MDEDEKDMEEEEYDFEYSDEEVEEADVVLENAYYAAKGLKAQGDLAGAVEGMQEVLRLEAAGERGEWGFKALKQSVKMLFALGQYEAMLERYVFLLDHYTVTPASFHGARAAVTQNVAEKGLDSVLDLVSSSSSPSLLRALYDTTLARLEGGEESGREGRAEGGARRRNQRLWFKTNLKLGHLLLSEAMQKEGGEHRAWRPSSLLLPLVSGSIPSGRGSPLILTLHCLLSPSFLPSEESVRLLGRLQRLIKDLLKSCEGPQEGPGEDGSAGGDTIKRGTQLLEVYALQMQLFALQKDSRKLKDLYKLALGITWGVPHPRTLGVLQECGGRMYMDEKDYNAAIQAFFSSFKCYDEAGDPRRFTLLKYLVLASMLHASTIDPFDSQEAKPYKEEREVVAMRNLILAFQNHDVKAFETILKVHTDRH